MTPTYKKKTRKNKYIFPKLSWSIFVSIFILMAAYVFFMQGTVKYTAGTHIAEVRIAHVSTELSDLEHDYITLTTKIDENEAVALGFVKADYPKFVSEGSLSSALSIQDIQTSR